MFDGFEASKVNVAETEIFIRRKGSGRPLLLLHGFPETHLMWHAVAPALADAFTVVCADLRGYGASGKPPSSPDHAPCAKTAMSRDMVRLMKTLGFSRFSVAGHDRGGRVAYRMAFDHAGHIERLAVLDIIPYRRGARARRYAAHARLLAVVLVGSARAFAGANDYCQRGRCRQSCAARLGLRSQQLPTRRAQCLYRAVTRLADSACNLRGISRRRDTRLYARHGSANSGRSRPRFRNDAARHSEIIPPTVPR